MFVIDSAEVIRRVLVDAEMVADIEPARMALEDLSSERDQLRREHDALLAEIERLKSRNKVLMNENRALAKRLEGE